MDTLSQLEECSVSCSCADIQGTLNVHSKDAANLPIGTHETAPYVSVTAAKGSSLSRITKMSEIVTVTQDNIHNLVWNETLSFGCANGSLLTLVCWK